MLLGVADGWSSPLNNRMDRAFYALLPVRQRLRKQKREHRKEGGPPAKKQRPEAEDASEPRRAVPPPKKKIPTDTPWNTIFVNQLPYACTQLELAEAFATAAGLSAA